MHQGGRAERAGREDRMGQVKAKSNRDRDRDITGETEGEQRERKQI